MKTYFAAGVVSVGLSAGLSLGAGYVISAQGSSTRANSHVAAAKTAAGEEWSGVFSRVCPEAVRTSPPTPRGGAASTPRPAGPPERSTWYAEPAKVFDNLYFVGQSEYSAWAVTTSAGIIIIDSIFDYSVQEEVEGGMKKLGLDPAAIKYVVVSHGHSDHSGGARFLQDKFGARVILAAEDWDLLDRSSGTKPKRDMVATDGMKLTLGDTTLTIHKTPGHTLGTISTLIPVKDNGVAHLAAYWGGTAFNWVNGPQNYITPERPASFWFKTYSDSASRFRDIAARAGADVLLSNHTIFDGSKQKLPLLATRKPGQAHPYVIGKESVMRYLTVVDECARAGLANVTQ
jgi:metallo-beta-lactamase class B